MKSKMKKGIVILAVVMAFFAFSVVAFASSADTAEATATTTEAIVEQAEASVLGSKAIAAAITIAVAAGCGAVGMALAISKSVDGIARQPEASGKIQTNLMLGLVFIETAIIYALIVAILIIFVL